METFAASDERRARLLRAILASDAAAGTAGRSEPRDGDDRISPGASLALIVLSSLGLWALVWFALRCLITNWP